MKKRILVTEDHEDTRLILRALLTYHGYEMFEAYSAEQMLEDLESVAPDLIVLDVRLPGMDGCEGLNRLRENGFTKPVFLFSEYFDLFSHDIKSCKPDGFFPKSHGPVDLIKAIDRELSEAGAAP